MISPKATPARTGGPFMTQDLVDPRNAWSCACQSNILSIPSWLTPWIGKFNIPRAIAAYLLPSLFPCNSTRCVRSKIAQTVQYHPPTWFAYVEASIRFEAFPIHFCIQTPRVVPTGTLRRLGVISVSDFMRKLSLREITIHDVEPSGASVLHVSRCTPRSRSPYA